MKLSKKLQKIQGVDIQNKSEQVVYYIDDFLENCGVTMQCPSKNHYSISFICVIYKQTNQAGSSPTHSS